MGLRERKKQATRTAIADAALALFLQRGFEAVTVADVARAADVSVNTVFNYFRTKEDLFFDRQEEVVGRLAAAIAERRPGETLVSAVRRAFLEALEAAGPTTGLGADVARFWKVVEESPALQARLRLISELSEAALAEAIVAHGRVDAALARVAAAVMVGIDRALHEEIRRRMIAGDTPQQVREALVVLADQAFALVDR